MSEKINTNKEIIGKKTSSNKAEAGISDNSISEYLDTRAENVTQRKLQESANNSIQLKGITTLQKNADENSNVNKISQFKEVISSQKKPTIQLQNKLTMHHKDQPKEKQKAGGGIGSAIKTGHEVNNVIKAGDKTDIKDSKNALDQSIGIREEEQKRLGGDAGHAHRIVQEKTWKEKLQEWLNRFFPKKPKRRNQEATDEEWGEN